MILSPETISDLQARCLAKDAPAMMRYAEGLAFAKVAHEMSREALIQVAGLNKNISTVAAIAIVEKFCNQFPN